MSKKVMFLLVALAVVMLTVPVMGVVSDHQTFRFGVRVRKYIEVNPCTQVNFVLPPISPPGGSSPPGISLSVTQNEVAYANCPLTIYFVGNNPAGDGLPIFARQEVGPNANGYDRLQTRLEFHRIINDAWWGAVWTSDPEGAATGSWFDGRDYCPCPEAPHDGEIGMCIKAGAALPHQSPEFGVDNTWNQSADAGCYRCRVTAWYVAL